METRANHLMIGIFALTVTFLAFAFVMWLSNVRVAQQYAYYDVKFPDGISGLPVGGEVRYNGVKVGTVEDIRFAPQEPGAVFVVVKIENRDDFTVRQNTEASLEFLGITGLTYILLAGGTTDSPTLPVITRPGARRPVIVAQPSTIQQLVVGIPELVAQAERAFERVNDVLSEENRARIDNIMADLEGFSSALGDIKALTGDANKFLNEDAKTATQEIGEAADALKSLAALGEEVLAENRDALNEFSSQGLGQVALFVTEARSLVVTLDRIGKRIESDPARYLLGGPQGEEVEVAP